MQSLQTATLNSTIDMSGALKFWHKVATASLCSPGKCHRSHSFPIKSISEIKFVMADTKSSTISTFAYRTHFGVVIFEIFQPACPNRAPDSTSGSAGSAYSRLACCVCAIATKQLATLRAVFVHGLSSWHLGQNHFRSPLSFK